MNRNKTPLFLGAALILGIAGSLFRAKQLAFAFEADTGLLVSGNGDTAALRILCAAGLVICIAFGLYDFLTRNSYPAASRAAGRLLFVAGGLVLVFSTLIEVIFSGFSSVSRVIYLLFSAFAGFSVLIAAARGGDGDYAFFRIVPAFWSCFWLVLLYRDRSPIPTVDSYVYEIIPVLLATMMFYFAAGTDFARPRPHLVVFFCAALLFFGTVEALGQFICRIVHHMPTNNAEGTLYIVACVLCAVGAALGQSKEERTEGIKLKSSAV